MFDSLVLFAAQQGPDIWNLMYLILAFFLVYYFVLLRPQQKRDRAKQQGMITAMKKNTRVLTHSGIYGVVSNVNLEANEVTIKVDEATNTKLRMTLSSIYRVLDEESSEAKSVSR